jgi:glycosyltransferase involved in cell wall biosynthesis
MVTQMDRLDTSTDSVSVLMAVRNGETYLNEQLNSIYAQTQPNITLRLSDDGSTDGSMAVMQQHQAVRGPERFFICKGPQQGFAANFMSLLMSPEVTGDYFALADQDDIWEKDKIARAITALKKFPADKPALYCSRSRLVNANNEQIGFSQLYKRAPSFANALVQNIAGGNTMVLNKPAHELIKALSANIIPVYHDWWVYIVVTAVGGNVIYDSSPTLRYRQHGNNQIGGNTGLMAKLLRLKFVLNGRYHKWNNINIAAIDKIIDHLTPENKQIFLTFCRARKAGFWQRLYGLKQAKVYRQSKLDNAGLFAAALLNRL